MKYRICGRFPFVCSLERCELREVVRQKMLGLPRVASEAETTCFEGVEQCESSYGTFPRARSIAVYYRAWLVAG